MPVVDGRLAIGNDQPAGVGKGLHRGNLVVAYGHQPRHDQHLVAVGDQIAVGYLLIRKKPALHTDVFERFEPAGVAEQ